MAYRVATCVDSAKDAVLVDSILHYWAEERKVSIQAEVFPSAESLATLKRSWMTASAGLAVV